MSSEDEAKNSTGRAKDRSGPFTLLAITGPDLQRLAALSTFGPGLGTPATGFHPNDIRIIDPLAI